MAFLSEFLRKKKTKKKRKTKGLGEKVATKATSAIQKRRMLEKALLRDL